MSEQNVAIVTGASKGIGKAIAIRLAKLGYNLVLSSRTQSKLDELVKELEAISDKRFLAVACDVAKGESVDNLIETTKKEFGRIDVLINNAGIASKIALLQEMPRDMVSDIIDTNLKGAIYMMQGVIPPMVEQQSGIIININSVAGKNAYPFWSVYDASKFGLRAITEAVAQEQRENGIKVVGIYPGCVDTPIWNTLENEMPMGRDGMLDADMVADTVTYVLKQPEKVFIPELTLEPLRPAL